MPTRPYDVDVQLRWSDMDALRHVNNVQFARLLEEARVIAMRQWTRAAGEDAHHPPMLIARAEIDYLRQLVYRPEPVVIAVWVTRIAGASFDLGYEVLDSRDEDAEVYARGETTLVCFDMKEQRPQRVPDDYRLLLQKYVGEPVPMKRRAASDR